MIGTAAAVSMGCHAVADIPLAFDLAGPGGNTVNYMLEMQGSLDGASIEVDFTNEGGFAWAGDLLIGFIDPSGNAVEYGGFDTSFGFTSAGDFEDTWDSSTSGAYTGSFSLAEYGLSGAGEWTILLADGYSGGEATDRWTGILGLEGVEIIPAPGALALLELGLAPRRRRNR